MTKVISINSNRFVIPAEMSQKDIQALAGFLITLVPVEYEYEYGQGRSLYYPGERGAEVRIETLHLMTKAEAEAQAKAAREAYEAKKAAEKSAE